MSPSSVLVGSLDPRPSPSSPETPNDSGSPERVRRAGRREGRGSTSDDKEESVQPKGPERLLLTDEVTGSLGERVSETDGW